MASSCLFVFLSMVAVLLPSVALAKVFMVGDEVGWTIGFDYQAWAHGKDFRVGDQLVFHYSVGVHNVYKVNAPDFQDCTIPLEAEAEALTTGHDTITLLTPGTKWYVCGVGKHCELGPQKVAITVQPGLLAPTSAPTWAPESDPTWAPESVASIAPSPNTYWWGW